MADVLIRGMEMPTSCWDCPFHDEDVCYPGDMSIDRGHHSDRSPYCPLIEVHDHGRLIDADKFYEDVTESAIMTDDFKEAFAVWIETQETVIPASGGEQ